MSSLVIDASAAIHVARGSALAPILSVEIEKASVTTSPRLFVSEAANALWKYVKLSDLTLEAALQMCSEAIHLVDVWADDRELAAEALTLAVAAEHPAYDLIYAVLARRRQATILTVDRRLRKLLSELEIPFSPRDQDLARAK